MGENGVNHQTDNLTSSSETPDINTALTHIEGLEIDKRSELVSKSLNITTINDASETNEELKLASNLVGANLTSST